MAGATRPQNVKTHQMTVGKNNLKLDKATPRIQLVTSFKEISKDSQFLTAPSYPPTAVKGSRRFI